MNGLLILSRNIDIEHHHAETSTSQIVQRVALRFQRTTEHHPKG